MKHSRGVPYHPQTQGKSLSWFANKPRAGSETQASDFEEPHPSGKQLRPSESDAQIENSSIATTITATMRV